MENIEIKIETIEIQCTPEYAHRTDAGLDCRARETIIIPAQEMRPVPLGFKTELPNGYVGLLWGKSGLANRHQLQVLGGVIDAEYRGEWIVLLKNLGTEEVVIEQYQKCCQALIQKVEHATIKHVKSLERTERGEKGFGSTGLK